MVRQTTVAGWVAMPVLRRRSRRGEIQPPANAVPVPRLQKAFLGKDELGDARVEDRLPEMGNRDVSANYEPKGRVVDETPPRFGHHAEIRLAHGSSHP